ncbi:acyl carrier protein [Desulfatitalea tepidiphila]|uniref:acyl carrier protein n=1 Tax=Desulfatitalea tepidiphila TaxID=1185843 RepID=UPI0006B4232F|nr:phosphopantetheine-binding protein [Desulfatitalea tepidiphila]
MTRSEITQRILTIFSERFEIDHPGLDDDLREVHEFDSIDAIELLREIEIMLGSELTHDEKRQSMEISTINDIVDYVEALAVVRSAR